MKLAYTTVIETPLFWVALFGGIMGSVIVLMADADAARSRNPARTRLRIDDAYFADVTGGFEISAGKYFAAFCAEPFSILPFAVGAWYVLFHDWAVCARWLGGAVAWRLLWDWVIFRHPLTSILLKVAWSFCTAMYLAAAGYVFAFLIAFLAVGQGVHSASRDRRPGRRQ